MIGDFYLKGTDGVLWVGVEYLPMKRSLIRAWLCIEPLMKGLWILWCFKVMAWVLHTNLIGSLSYIRLITN